MEASATSACNFHCLESVTECLRTRSSSSGPYRRLREAEEHAPMLPHLCHASSLRAATASLLLCVALLAPPARADRALPPEVVLPWTPVRALLPDYCGPASLTNILRHWGRPADQAAIGRALFDPERHGTLPGELILQAQQAGLQAISRSGSREDLRRWLAAGLPVIVLQDLSAQDRRGHFRVVVGYSDTRRQFFVCDCTDSSLCSLDYEHFDDLWFHFENWCLLIAPPGRMAPASPGDPDNPVLHFDLAEAYLRRGDHAAARQELRAVLRLNPSHRAAGRLLARLDRSGASSANRRTTATAAVRP
jgi:hypothetical protein